jgi:hypothetical protein
MRKRPAPPRALILIFLLPLTQAFLFNLREMEIAATVPIALNLILS